MWNQTPTSWELRMSLPAVAKSLEEIYISEYLHSLGLVTSKLSRLKGSTFRIKLAEGYELHLTAVDKGAGGYAEWFSWHAPAHVHAGVNEKTALPESSIRAHIQLMLCNDEVRSEIYSFTHHHQNVETLIKTSLAAIQHDLGLKLKPQLRKRKGSAKRE